MGLDLDNTGAEAMDKCPHHDSVVDTLDDIRTELRAIRSTQDAMMLHLIPQQTRANGISISAGNTSNGASSAGADWSRLWISILLLACVVVGGWLAHLGFKAHPQQAQQVEVKP